MAQHEPKDKTYKSWWIEEEEQDKGNFSNDKYDTFMPDLHFLGVRLQQGVPLLDRDWNELEDQRRYAEMSRWAQFIGNGVPDEKGFEIQKPDSGVDFKIYKGLCLVDGFLAENQPANGEDYVTYSKQPEEPPPLKLEENIKYIVYLMVWVQMVTAKKKGYEWLENTQDVGIETCIRHRLAWQVLVRKMKDTKPKEDYKHYCDLQYITINGGQLQPLDRICTTNLNLAKLINNNKNGRV